MATKLLMPAEVDRVLKYPRGRTLRLAKAGKIPHVVLPDGEIRISHETIDQLSQPSPASGQPASEFDKLRRRVDDLSYISTKPAMIGGAQ